MGIVSASKISSTPLTATFARELVDNFDSCSPETRIALLNKIYDNFIDSLKSPYPDDRPHWPDGQPWADIMRDIAERERLSEDEQDILEKAGRTTPATYDLPYMMATRPYLSPQRQAIYARFPPERFVPYAHPFLRVYLAEHCPNLTEETLNILIKFNDDAINVALAKNKAWTEEKLLELIDRIGKPFGETIVRNREEITPALEVALAKSDNGGTLLHLAGRIKTAEAAETLRNNPHAHKKVIYNVKGHSMSPLEALPKQSGEGLTIGNPAPA